MMKQKFAYFTKKHSCWKILTWWVTTNHWVSFENNHTSKQIYTCLLIVWVGTCQKIQSFEWFELFAQSNQLLKEEKRKRERNLVWVIMIKNMINIYALNTSAQIIYLSCWKVSSLTILNKYSKGISFYILPSKASIFQTFK